MKGLDGIVEYINGQLSATFCADSQTDFYCLTEQMSDGTQFFPVTVQDGRATKIMPDSVNRLKVFWRIEGDVRLEDGQSYGRNLVKLLRVTLVLYVIGRREMLGSECISTVPGLITELAESIPRDSGFTLSTEVQKVFVKNVRFNQDTRGVLAQIYSGADINQLLVTHLAGSISLDIEANVCDTLCANPADICPPFDPATVFDQGTPHQLGSGETYTCETVTLEEVVTVDYDFTNSATQRQIIHIWRTNGRIDFNAAVLTGCTAVFYKNGVAVTGIQGMTWGDKFWIEATSSGPLAGSVQFTLSYSSGADTLNAPEFFPITYQNIQNSTTLDQWRYDHAVLMGNNGLKNWQHSGESVESASGAARFRFFWAQNQFSGIRAAVISYPANHYFRIEFCLYCVNGIWQYYESGSLKASYPGTYQQGYIFELRPNLGTGKVDVYVSQDDGATFALWTSSTNSFTTAPPDDFHVDVVVFPSFQRSITPQISYAP